MRILKVLTVATAATVLSTLTGVAPAQADSITVTVDYGADVGPSNQVASGYLHGIDANSPAQYLIDGVTVRAIRGADHHPNLPSLFDRPTYDRVKDTGARLQVGVYYYVADPNHPDRNYRPGDGGDQDRWRNIVNSVYDEARTNNYDVDSWITWNEPDLQWNTTARPFTSYLAAHKVAYDTLKARDSALKVQAPELSSYSFARLTQFLTYCKQNNCLPEVLSWHELTAGAPDIPGHTAQIKQWMIDNGITPMPIAITEYQGTGYGKADAWDAGVNVRYLAQFERSVPNGLTDGLYSAWEWVGDNPDFVATLGNATTRGANLPRGVWWNYNTYKDMTGRLARTTSSAATTVDAFTAVDTTQRRSTGLIGNQTTATHTVTLDLRNIPAALQRGGKIRLRATRFDDLGELTNPVKVLEGDYTVTGNTAQVSLPALPASASLRFDVSPVIAGSPKTVYEAESLPVTSTSGVVRRNFAEEGASAGQASVLESTAVGQSVTYTVNAPATGRYELSAYLKRLTNRGFFQLYVDGKAFGPPQDEYGTAAEYYRTTFGHLQLSAGQHTLQFKVVGKNASSSNHWMAFDRFELFALS
ncbi:hypothetical protein [Streptomyces gossypiisoli]|uniref:hypothetical protein n=1 Tax=Streptomyces gossypiisoli TaxID=2748864 RepID=UPI0015D98A23|nr:hypothetical protein [Streptomyces gossypiisoli]